VVQKPAAHTAENTTLQLASPTNANDEDVGVLTRGDGE
jgi:hypothetical protein